MRNAIPPIAEPVGDLTQRRQREHDGHKKSRLRMLYLLARGQAHTRQDVAHTLGISRNTVGCWLAHCEVGGVAALVTIATPAGKHPARAPQVLASIAQALQQPTGVGSYEALRPWVACTHHVQIKCQNALHHGAHALQGQP